MPFRKGRRRLLPARTQPPGRARRPGPALGLVTGARIPRDRRVPPTELTRRSCRFMRSARKVVAIKAFRVTPMVTPFFATRSLRTRRSVDVFPSMARPLVGRCSGLALPLVVEMRSKRALAMRRGKSAGMVWRRRTAIPTNLTCEVPTPALGGCCTCYLGHRRRWTARRDRDRRGPRWCGRGCRDGVARAEGGGESALSW